jgi:signal transduction histidine kinase
MANIRLRTQLLIANLLIVCTLTGAILFIIRGKVRSEIDQQVSDSTTASLHAFTIVEKQRELQLSRAAALVAELPVLKAMMTTEHAPTIQDASTRYWYLAGSDLFIVASSAGKILGFHVHTDAWNPAIAGDELKQSLEQGEESAWWYAAGELYWVFLRPITSGVGSDSNQLGLIVVGEQVDSTVAQQLAVVAGGQVVLTSGNSIIASTFSVSDQRDLQSLLRISSVEDADSIRDVTLHSDQYAVKSILIHDSASTPVRCYVLVSLMQANQSIRQLNRTIFILALSAVILGALLLSFVSRTITRPLDNLVAGVRALAAGDYAYAITPHGSSEVAEVGEAFAKMRSELLASQQRWIANERTAALGRAASSISHDLRHYLAALVANAEFLYEADKLKLDKDDVYNEIKMASDQMLDLLDSFRELSRENGAIAPVPSSLEHVVRHAVDAALTRPEFRTRVITVRTSGEMEGAFDPKKVERAFFNLILNSCEATPQWQGNITIEISSDQESFEVRVIDNGPGIPSAVRSTLFDPFVSSGKPNGTGLGLAIVNKIVHDHSGSVIVERTSESGTVFLVKLPRFSRIVNPSPQPVIP